MGPGRTLPRGAGGALSCQVLPQPSCQPSPCRLSSPLLPAKPSVRPCPPWTKQAGSFRFRKVRPQNWCGLLRPLGSSRAALSRSHSPRSLQGPSLRTPRGWGTALLRSSGMGAPEVTRWPWWRATCSHMFPFREQVCPMKAFLRWGNADAILETRWAHRATGPGRRGRSPRQEGPWAKPALPVHPGGRDSGANTRPKQARGVGGVFSGTASGDRQGEKVLVTWGCLGDGGLAACAQADLECPLP